MKLLISILSLVSLPALSCENMWAFEPPKGTLLCNSFYSAVYDETSRSPVATSYIVPIRRVNLNRTGSFYDDRRVSNESKTSDYYKSGYDRGHLIPAEDAQTYKHMKETFLYTNAVPQNPTLNRGNWVKLERMIRDKKQGCIVQTNIVLSDKKIGTGIPVPSHLIKIISCESNVEIYSAKNEASNVEQISEEELVNLGVNLSRTKH